MLKIRLARHGSKKRPFYHIVVADARAPRDGAFIEKLGTYDPMLPKTAQRLVLNTEKSKEWLAKGAQATDRVAKFLGEAGVIEKKVYAETQTKQHMPRPKTVLRNAEKEQKLAAAKEAEEEAKRAAIEAAAQAKLDAEEAKRAAAEAAAAPAPVVEEAAVEEVAAEEEVVAETPAEVIAE